MLTLSRSLRALQETTATETPGTGPAELLDLWPFTLRAAWFLVGFSVVFVVGWYVFEPAASRIIRGRNRNNPTVQEAISRYLRLLVLVVAVVAGAGVAGYGRFLGDSALVVAAGTLALGVAGQTVFGSLISGLVLVVDPEFNVGDYIEWADGEGTVRSITLRVTRVQTLDGELVTIPNTILTGQPITRPYGRGRYRMVDHVGLAYEEDVDDAIERLEAAAEGVEGIATGPTPNAYVDELGEEAVVMRVHYWVENPAQRDLFAVRSAYARSAKASLEAAGIAISPPSQRELLGRVDVGEVDADENDSDAGENAGDGNDVGDENDGETTA